LLLNRRRAIVVFTTQGKNAVRNWLAGESTSDYPTAIIWSAETSSANLTDTSVPALLGKGFLDVETSVERQVQWEGIVLTTELTTSTIGKIAIATTTTGTGGTLYISENINPIAKTNQFDLQTLVIAEVE
jgi:hypothetical protein